MSPASPPSSSPKSGAEPRLWGLSARELHVAFWNSQGVQCVECARPIPLQRAADLYLLVQPDHMVIFELPALMERLLWRNARITRLRVVDERGEPYREELEFDQQGCVRSVSRRYRPASRSAARVLLTRSRRLAAAWMNATDPRTAWDRIRRSVPWSSIDHMRCRGNRYDNRAASEQASFVARLVEAWHRPDRAIDGIESPEPGVWTLAGDAPITSSVVVGPLWAGAGAVSGSDDCILGPDWRPDEREIGPGGVALVRPINQVDPPEAPQRAGAPTARHWCNSRTKRVMDVVLSTIGLVLALPVFPIIAACILLEDGRPIFFGHTRQTRGGRPFRCWKFRSMRRNAEDMLEELRERDLADGPQVFIRDDPRVTRVGAFLRTSHLDELPQLWNVLRGEMSLVGPRPSPDDENQFCPAWRDLRLSVRPGITGLWQVTRTRAPGTDFQEWIRFDIEYVRTASFMMDVAICARTVFATALGRRDDATK